MASTDDYVEKELSHLYDTDDDLKVAAFFTSVNKAVPNRKFFYRIDPVELNKKLDEDISG